MRRTDPRLLLQILLRLLQLIHIIHFELLYLCRPRQILEKTQRSLFFLVKFFLLIFDEGCGGGHDFFYFDGGAFVVLPPRQILLRNFSQPLLLSILSHLAILPILSFPLDLLDHGSFGSVDFDRARG